MSAKKRRRKSMERRNAWKCSKVGCSRWLWSHDEIESRMCLPHLVGHVRPDADLEAVSS